MVRLGAAWLFAVVLSAGVAAGQAAPPAPAVDPLRPGAPVERPLAPDGTLRLAVTLAAGELAEVTVDQLGIDAIVAVSGPDGAAIDETDDASELDGPERLRIVAGAAGEYLVAVRSEPLAGVQAGRVRLALAQPRAATDADRAALADRRAGEARTLAAIGRYEEMRKTGRIEPEAAAALIDELGRLAAADASAGRLRLADRARATQSHLLLLLDRNREVITIAEQRLPRLKAARSAAVRAAALTQLAEAATRVGEVPRAIALFEEALTIPQTPGAEAITRDNLGNTLRRAGRLQEAMQAHQRALDYFTRNGPRRSVGVVLSRLGLVWRQLGDFQRAATVETEALAVFTEVGDRLGEVRALTNLAGTLRDAGDYTAARTMADRALAAALAAKSEMHEAHALLVLASVDLRTGREAEAEPRSRRAAEVFHAAEFVAGEALALTSLGDAQLAIGRPAEAADTMQRAVVAARATGNPDDESSALHVAARVARARGDLDGARATLEATLECLERVRANIGGTQFRAVITARNYVVYEDHIDVLMALDRARPGQDFARLALEASELSRARALLDALATAAIDVRTGVDADLLERERSLRARLADKDVARRRADDAGRAEDAAAIGREIAALAGDLQMAESQIAASGPAFATLTRPRAVGLEALRAEVLDADTVLLEYAVGTERSWLFALTPTTLDAFELPKRSTLARSARAVLDATTARQQRAPGLAAAAWQAHVAARDAEVRDALATLGAELLGPVADRLRGAWRDKRLVVVATGPLEYVPFAALPIPGGPAAVPLVAAHEVVSAPSAAAIAALRREAAGRRPAAKTLAIVADPVFEPGDPRVRRSAAPATASPGALPAMATRGPRAARDRLTRLLFSRREATAIAALLPEASRLTITDFAASRDRVLRAPLADYRIVHFATHGLIDTAQPGLSSLALSLVDERGAPVDGYLRMQDIYNQKLPVDLVVLSACRTALGEQLEGEGLVGLTRGFMYAGARGVVASLWQVDDQATAQLMTRFYQHLLRDGARPAAALRQAQRELAADRRWAAPYYWAGFVIQGDWR